MITVIFVTYLTVTVVSREGGKFIKALKSNKKLVSCKVTVGDGKGKLLYSYINTFT